MCTAFLLAALTPVPVNLDSLSVERARVLSGRVVVASFVATGRAAEKESDERRGYDQGGWRRGRAMTEAEWLTATTPDQMIWCPAIHLRNRKAGLFNAACLRRIWHLLPGPSSRRAVELREQVAERGIITDELVDAILEAQGEANALEAGGTPHLGQLAGRAAGNDESEYLPRDVARVVACAEGGDADAVSTHEQRAQSDLMRCIFGNPFCPVALHSSWLTSTVVALASGMYESRDFSPMPILADALQDAGCENEDILNHCRGRGPHVRGCWVVDLMLGKV